MIIFNYTDKYMIPSVLFRYLIMDLLISNKTKCKHEQVNFSYMALLRGDIDISPSDSMHLPEVRKLKAEVPKLYN